MDDFRKWCIGFLCAAGLVVPSSGCFLLPLPTNAPLQENACSGVAGKSLKKHVFALEEMDGVACVAGNVSMIVSASTAFPALILVGGTLSVDERGPAPVRIEFPVLERAGHVLSVDTDGSLSMSAPKFVGRVVHGCTGTTGADVDAPLATVEAFHPCGRSASSKE